MPSQAIVDLRVSRRFRLGGRVQLEPIFEVFNLFNRTNYIETNNVSSAFIWGHGRVSIVAAAELRAVHAGRPAAAGAAGGEGDVLKLSRPYFGIGFDGNVVVRIAVTAAAFTALA